MGSQITKRQLLHSHLMVVVTVCYQVDWTGMSVAPPSLYIWYILFSTRHLKVYNIEDYRVIESFTYPAPILSVAMSVGKFLY